MSSGGADGPQLRVSAATHPGRVRERNEDSIGVTGWSAGGEVGLSRHAFSGDVSLVVCAVADGVGGQPAGEVASALVVERLVHAPAPSDTRGLSATLVAIHDDLIARGAETPQLAGMASTVAVIVVTADAVLCANIGDTRVYEVQLSELTRISFDDHPDIPDADPALLATTLTQALGGFTRQPPDPHPQWFAREEGLAFLLCTDGLTALVDDAEMRAVLEGFSDDGDAIRRFVGLALERGAPDNVSVMLLRVA